MRSCFSVYFISQFSCLTLLSRLSRRSSIAESTTLTLNRVRAEKLFLRPVSVLELLGAEFHEFIASWEDGCILTCKYIRMSHIASHLSVSTEGTMRTHSQPRTTPQAVDQRTLSLLNTHGAQSLEGLCSITRIGWAQVFRAVDRLSRIGKVSRTRVRPCEYQISIGGLLRR